MTTTNPTVEERVKKLDDDWEISLDVHWPKEVLADIAETIRSAVAAATEVERLRKQAGRFCGDHVGGMNIECVVCENDRLDVEIERLREALDEYGEHTNRCVYAEFHGYDPERGWHFGDKWLGEPPSCNCGLTAALDSAGPTLPSEENDEQRS